MSSKIPGRVQNGYWPDVTAVIAATNAEISWQFMKQVSIRNTECSGLCKPFRANFCNKKLYGQRMQQPLMVYAPTTDTR
ncbi:MAG: hypothetical protein F9K48_03480 [Candidatus Brocadia sp.]|nr:MAG: hypothetical protein F9K48_03480 [Candidatus Brocadia sp.]